MNAKRGLMAFVVCAMAMASPGWAALIAYEDFAPKPPANAGTGIVTANLLSGNTWTSGYDNSQYPRFHAGDLSYSPLVTSTDGYKAFLNNQGTVTGGNRGWSNLVHNAVTGGGLYHSFLMSVGSVTGLATTFSQDSTFFMVRNPGGSGNVLAIRADGSGGFNLGLAKQEGDLTDLNPAPYISGSLSTDTTYLIVLGTNAVETANSTWNIWINPTSLGGAAPAATGSTVWRENTLGFADVYLGDEDTGAPLPVMYIDDVRVGSNYADVTPVPEPAMLGLLTVGACLGLWRRGKRE